MKIRLLRDKMKNFDRVIQQTIFLICLIGSIMIFFPQSGLAETNPIEIEKISLSEALHRISMEYQVFFSYDQEAVEDIEVNYEPDRYQNVEHALDRMLKGTSLHYRIFNNRYIILYESSPQAINSLRDMVQHLETVIDKEERVPFRRNLFPLAKLPTRSAFSVKPIAFTVSGTITDDTGEPLIGVNIQVKGSNKGTSTDFDGEFTLEDIDENAILVISYVGYETQEIPVAGKSNLDIVMSSDSQLLDEVVVVGYGTQKRANISGAVSSIGADQLENRPLTSVGEGLQGTISNLNITPSSGGGPGQGASFNIRGTTSLTGGEPLILVNGVSMDVNMISPQDIESVTVLKDAASAAIYGARAAFGVILITTKSGKADKKPVISLNSSISSNSPTRTIDWMNSKEHVEWMDEAYLRTTGRPYYDDIEREAILAHFNDPSQPSSIMHPKNQSEWTNVANTDWNKILMDDSYPMQNHSISISGGTEKLSYYSSFSYLNQQGIINKDLFNENYKRYNILTDLNYDANRWINVGTRVSANLSNKNFPANDSWFRSSFPEGALPYQANTYPILAYKDPNGKYAHMGSIHNLAQMLEEGGYQKRSIADIWLTGTLKMMPIKNISINLDYTYNPKYTNYMHYVSLLPFYDKDGSINAYYGGSNPNRVIRENNVGQYHAFNIYANYNKQFSDGHDFQLMVGFNQELTDLMNIYAERRNLIINKIPYMGLASGDRFTDDGHRQYSIRGTFGRFNYNYKQRYYIEFNGRYDGTSKFPKSNRFAFFPSGSIAWRLDQEEFFANHLIEMLKIRASYGVLGNQNISGFYPYVATLGTSEANYLIGGERPVEVTPPGLISPALTWETVLQKNIGIDLELFNSKLAGSFDLYRRDTKDMLTKGKTLPAVIGTTEPQENAADLKTIGWDMNIGWRSSYNKLNYSASFILSNYKGVITKFDNPNGLINDHYVGKDIGEIWGLVTGGVFQSDEEAAAYNGNKIVGRKREAGDLWHEDLDGDGEISYGNSTLDDPGDRKIIGNNTPKYSFGLRSTLDWKNFDLVVFFQGVGKRDLWMSTKYFLDAYTAEWGPRSTIMLDYWSPDNPDAHYPRPIRTNSGDITAVQTRFLQNAAYVRLKQLTVGYTIPVNINRLNNLRIYFTGSNLWTGTKMVDISDPELNGPSVYPLYKSFTGGISLQF